MCVSGRAAMCAKGFVLVGPAAPCAFLCALMSVNGSGSPLDKAQFTCLLILEHFVLSFC